MRCLSLLSYHLPPASVHSYVSHTVDFLNNIIWGQISDTSAQKNETHAASLYTSALGIASTVTPVPRLRWSILQLQ